MTTITIRTVGNPALYQSLQSSIASETRHRTVSGALRRLEAIHRASQRWAETMGNWGGVEIEIDGEPLGGLDVGVIEQHIADYLGDPQDVYARRYATEMLTP